MSEPAATLRALIVDDELHGRDVVRHMLQNHPDISIVGEASNGVRALEEIRSLRPDVVFLDIQMPKLSGIALVDQLGDAVPRAIVFITAHDNYAVQAFERSAFDYLLKPFDQERFDRTIARVREQFRTAREADIGRRLREVFQSGAAPDHIAPNVLSNAPAPDLRSRPLLTRFVVKETGRVFFVPVSAADWLEASGNYVALHVEGKTHLIYETLANIEQALDGRQFLRIHRSTIVNVDRIKELQPFTNSELVVILRDGTRLKLSRSFREHANQVLGLR